MKLVTSIFLFSFIVCVNSQVWFRESLDFLDQARQGAGDMWRAYRDMREANYKNSDKYFHARGNYDAAKRGPGGAWAAEVISNTREFLQGGSFGRNVEDSMADQEANRWGRSGKDPNHFRPKGLDPKY
ncbi:serum amyloid A protein [Trichosurus vulpecula]|uniref:serum amyloid A protein n=1 Tax=Trichosurus vulpecula TaxID=9337 RepID=UPI00186AE19F|nr:serum amyloid A protein [Trichosurus vulpecula]XP_036619292.1 serum amyloid A protein [Trichosurus vulpecula]